MFSNLQGKFIDDCKKWYKLWSIWFHTASTAIIGVLLLMPSMPAEVQVLVPVPYRAIAIAVWLVLGFFLRVKKQGAPTQ